MATTGLLDDIRKSIKAHFAFLQSYGFSAFSENQLAFEFHYECRNDAAAIDIWLEAISASPVWVTINGYDVSDLEPDNERIKTYSAKYTELYDEYFSNYLKTDDAAWLTKITEQYRVSGQALNDDFLAEIAGMLQRNSAVLLGETDLLQAQQELRVAHRAYLLHEARAQSKLYTCTIRYASGMEAECESATLEGIRANVRQAPQSPLDPITTIEVYDWHGQQIPFADD